MNTFRMPEWGMIDMGVRRQARNYAVQFLYMLDYCESATVSDIEDLFDYFEVPKTCQAFTKALLLLTKENQDKIDYLIKTASKNWPISRMARVDKGILRIAVAELFFIADIPCNVTINEAIEISKKYSSEESPMFINGVLDKIAKTHAKQVKESKISLLEKENESSELIEEEFEPVKVAK